MKPYYSWIVIFLCLPLLGISQIQIGSDIDGDMAGDNFGKQVVLAANGSILGVLSNVSTGNIHIYQNVGENWELYGVDSEGGHFDGITASGLDFSDDGHTLAIGGEGAVNVYTFESGIWTQKGIVPNNTSDSSFGTQVYLSSDGNSIAISTPDYVYQYARYIPPPITTHGLVQVFNYKNGVWNQIGDDILAGHWLISAKSIGLSSDANRVVIANNVSVKVYEISSGIWTTLGNEITGVDGNSIIVKFSSDGNVVAIGNPIDSYKGNYGLVKIFKYESGNWVQFGNDIIGDSVQDYCGYNFNLSSDGHIVAISFVGNDSNGVESGQVRIFKIILGAWTQMGSNINGEAEYDNLGIALHLSPEANKLAIGTPYNNSNGLDAGEVKVYDVSATLSNNNSELSDIKLYPNPANPNFEIQLPSGQQLQKVTIFNALGQFVLSTKEPHISTRTMPQGVYFIEIETNLGSVTKKLVID